MSTSKQISLVSGLPLLCSLKPMLEKPHRFIAKTYKTHGEIFQFKVAHRDFVVMGGVDTTLFFAGEEKNYFGVEGF